MAFRTEVHSGQIAIKANRIATTKLRKIMRELEINAKLNAAGGPYSKGSTLARSIKSHGPVPVGLKVIGTVGSNLSYARSVDRGARIHPIFPKGAPHIYRFPGDIFYRRRPQLKFIWHGRIVFTPQVPMARSTLGVSHPGQKGKLFLERAAGFVATRYRMRLIVYPD